jgi:hypothetical protein
MSESISENVSWNERLETYFSSTAEKSQCLSWIHKQAESLYSQRRNYIDLPVIVGSAITGFMSVGTTTMFAGQEQMASIFLGVMSLVVGITNTIGAYFQFAKRCEGHRIASIQYARMFRFLTIEMSLPRDERMTPHDLLKYTKDMYDRLAEVSPMLPPECIEEFKKRFAKYENISKPEEANGLEHVIVYTNPVSFPQTPLG